MPVFTASTSSSMSARVTMRGGRDGHRVVQAGDAAGGPAHQHALPGGPAHDGRHHVLAHGRLRRLVLHQFHAGEQAPAADVADVVVVEQLPQAVLQVGPHRAAVLDQVLVLDDAQVLERGREPDGAAAVGADVPEVVEPVARIAQEPVEHLAAHRRRGDRGVGTRHALGHRHDVRDEVVVLEPEHRPRAPEPAHDLVDDQYDVIVVADLADNGIIFLDRRNDPPARGDRLEDHGPHRVRPLLLDRVAEGARALDVAVRIRLPEGTAVAHRVRNPRESVREGPVGLLALLLSAGGEAGDGRAVVVAVPVQDLRLAAPVQVGDLAHHLDRLLVGLGAAVGEEDVIQAVQPLGQRARILGGRDRADHARVVRQPRQLLVDDPRDALPPVADVHAPDAARGPVQVLLPVDVPDARAAPLHEHLRILRLEDAVLEQVVPEVLAVLLDDVLDVVVRQQRLCVGHPALFLLAGRRGPAGSAC